MALPKLLPRVVIDSTNNTFAFTFSGAQTVTIPSGVYPTILEVGAALRTQLRAVYSEFNVAVSSSGIVTITSDDAWTVNWAGTNDGLEKLLGFDGSEAVVEINGYTTRLTSSYRHIHGFYSPVGPQFPADSHEIVTWEQDTDDGGLAQIAGTCEHVRRKLSLGLLSPAQLDQGGTDSDGAGGTVMWTDRTLLDFWRYTKDKPFRYYANAELGTVDTPGTEGTIFTTWRRYADPWEPAQRDPSDWSFFDVTMRLKYVGEA